MSSEVKCPEEEDFGQFFTVFEGSSPEDVSHARQLWSSLSLLPPQESRLVSADIRQRLPVSRPQRSSTAGPRLSAPEPPSVPALRQMEEERRRYEAMADQRRETLALLKRHREQRVRKELLSVGVRTRGTAGRTERTRPGPGPGPGQSESHMDQEMVQQLQ